MRMFLKPLATGITLIHTRSSAKGGMVMNERYPWNQKYTDALNTGVRIGKVILLVEATTRATLGRACDFAGRLVQRRASRGQSI